MTELFEPVGDHDHRLALSATGTLADLNRAGLLEAGDLHVADRVADLAGGADDEVLLALALAVRAVRHGSVAVDLATVPDVAPELTWPDPVTWLAAVEGSRLVELGALRVEHGLVYLDRYARLEQQVCADLVARTRQEPPPVDEAALTAALARVGGRLNDQQREAAERSARQWTTVLTGGPGTGKTTTVARILAVLADQAAVLAAQAAPGAAGRRLSVALSAPTGKAAARLQEAVDAELAGLPEEDRDRLSVESMTLHRLLGWRADNATRFRHDRTNRLTHDVVVVDESSMVELTLMARLLEAVRPQARLLLVGDPRQLTSVGAGAVLSDLVAGHEGDPASPVVSLTENYRSRADIKTLAEALRTGTADEVLAALRAPSSQVEYVETDDPAAVLHDDTLASALAVRRAAEQGDPVGAVRALDEHRLLCAHREGPYGVRLWNRHVEQWLGEELGVDLRQEWYVGRPLLVTTNDHALEVYNGETGAVVLGADGRARAWIAGSRGLQDFAPGRLDAVETMHAMTIHKSQGSQARRVTVLLPEEGSRLLSRELFYTAVTRAQDHVRVVGSEAAVRAAVETRAQRATGLRQRLLAARGAGSAT
ncbi:exodeoxyribonuclease V subunit alpha [Nocardioides abyssi]|uniref:RecBCD enzyme subunit RecD n=1 Tax=Nocardioides abyssi TaxID=3058370 RepID=A0ABT8ET95_9ACTN|nr:exodeoxyribonuclease V subunit alpha [Nocardioides abyssi]MDN4161329.1 exodeoxyribonuclease V subunit alpha [Nocardioides abyssi]